MESDVSFPSYHGIIDCQTAIDRLGTISKPGTYLVRYFGNKYIISYLNQDMDIRHIAVSTQKDTYLRRCNPQITNVQTAVEFLLSSDTKMFAHLVPWQKFDTKQNPDGIRGNKNQCNICDYTFKDDKDRGLHPKSHRVTYCDKCDRIIYSSSFTSHLPCARIKNKQRYCEQCPYTTMFGDHLKKHILFRHTNAKIKCLKCEEMFPTTYIMENHMVKLHGHHKYLCHHCQKAFQDNYHLNRHIKQVHVKPIQSQNSQNLILQLQSSEETLGYISFLPPTKEQKNSKVFLLCDKCEFFTKHESNLKRHLEKQHQELTVLSF